MITAAEMRAMLRSDAKKAKKLFDLCETNGEGIYAKLHILENSRLPSERKDFRIYHNDGYCFDVTKEKVDLAEDESCDSCIGGYEYYFNEGMYEGFKEITIDEAIKLLNQI